ncbi:MAG: CopG family transcriptional regulator [Micromonosporaceae bacterium]
MQRTNIYLEDAQTESLDRLAADEGVSRAEIIRRMLDRGLVGQDEDLVGDLAAIEDSSGALADVDVPTRGPDTRAAHLDAMWGLSA